MKENAVLKRGSVMFLHGGYKTVAYGRFNRKDKIVVALNNNYEDVELALNVNKRATIESVNKVMKTAESEILGYNDKPLVSIDFTNDKHSAIFDATQTRVIDDHLIHVTAWYDNEWGFSNRMCDTAVAIGKTL